MLPALLGGAIFVGAALPAAAQEVHESFQERVRAEVLEVLDEDERRIMGTDATTTVQTLRIDLLGGQRAG